MILFGIATVDLCLSTCSETWLKRESINASDFAVSKQVRGCWGEVYDLQKSRILEKAGAVSFVSPARKATASDSLQVPAMLPSSFHEFCTNHVKHRICADKAAITKHQYKRAADENFSR